jgi:hypothetical protein
MILNFTVDAFLATNGTFTVIDARPPEQSRVTGSPGILVAEKVQDAASATVAVRSTGPPRNAPVASGCSGVAVKDNTVALTARADAGDDQSTKGTTRATTASRVPVTQPTCSMSFRHVTSMSAHLESLGPYTVAVWYRTTCGATGATRPTPWSRWIVGCDEARASVTA